VEQVAALPPEALPGFVCRLSALLAAAGARLAAVPANSGQGSDRLLTVEEAAARLATTEDWLRRHAPTLPFTVKLSEGQLRFSAHGIEDHIRRGLARRK